MKVLDNLAISFGNEPYYGSLKALERSYTKFDISFKEFTGDWLLQTEYGQYIKKTLFSQRGFFYWAWKPYIILEALKEANKVLYSDAAVFCIRDPKPLFDLLDKKNIVVFEHGNKELINQHWTKHDCFLYMNCNTNKYHKGVQLTATFSLWKNTPETIKFLEEWIFYCKDPRIITDQPNTTKHGNLQGFKDHRHDQSILSILSQKWDLERFRDPSQWGNEDRSFINSNYGQIFNHHRMRLFG